MTRAEHLPPSEFRKRAAAVEAREKEVKAREKEAARQIRGIKNWWQEFREEVAEQNKKLRALVRRLLGYGKKMRQKVDLLEDENRRQKKPYRRPCPNCWSRCSRGELVRCRTGNHCPAHRAGRIEPSPTRNSK